MESGNRMPETLYAEHKAISVEIGVAERAVENLKAQRKKLVKELFDRHGKGPFTFDGDKYNIVLRKGADGSVDSYSLTKAPQARRAAAPAAES